jgi:hypothetical protein
MAHTFDEAGSFLFIGIRFEAGFQVRDLFDANKKFLGVSFVMYLLQGQS